MEALTIALEKGEVLQEGLARKLRFGNPNVRRGCGCGESFGV